MQPTNMVQFVAVVMSVLLVGMKQPLLAHARVASSDLPPPQTFGRGIPNFPFSTEEQVIFEHTLSPGSVMGAITHMWSTACGTNANPNEFTTNSGVLLYRVYVDGEEEASIELTPRMATGIGFPPSTNGGSGSGGGGGGSGSHDETRADEFVMGARGQDCMDACTSRNMVCDGNVSAGLDSAYLGDFMSKLVRMDTGASCVQDTQPWWAPDQPSYVWAKNNSNYGRCLGFSNVPPVVPCNGSHPLVNRMCRCTSRSSGRGLRSLAPPPAVDGVDAPVPWGTEWLGRTSDMDGYFWNIQMPFYKSIKVTGMVPQGLKSPFTAYTIVRGQENVPIVVGGRTLPDKAVLKTYSLTNIAVPSLGFIPVVNTSSGSGVVFGHTIAIQGNPSFTFLEGCWHLIPNVSGTGYLPNGLGIAAGFPGVLLSTGMEDYYDSSFYFHAGMFQLPVSGVTHMCAGGGRAQAPHAACAGTPTPTQSQWSAYRLHFRDPLWFAGGAQLLARNGDVAGPTPYGSAKCMNMNMEGGPGPSSVSSLAWVYEWED
eukprot:m.35942 g.35942  ORF g.35942 m.35942 type:complete len:537 (+) comp5344_c0_seq1:199-1809(+)